MLIRAHLVKDLLDLPLQRVYAMARKGDFPPGVMVRFGKTLRWNEELLTEWIKAGGSGEQLQEKSSQSGSEG